MTKSEMLKRIDEAADRNYDYIKKVAADTLMMPELGFKEFKTSQYVKNEFIKANVLKKENIGITGLRAELGSGDTNICVMGELDAIVCKNHPYSDKESGAAHACGHNGQLTVMLGVLKTLQDSGVMESLDGKVSFFAVPAEELIELDYREELKKDGKIKYLSGKQEFINNGEFDDVDVCMMIHAQDGEEKSSAYVGGSCLGMITKSVVFHGKAAHAGGAPHKGINALNAAMLSMINMHVSRETYRDEDKVRIHPIITKGGDVVNSVPHEVIMSNVVRAYNRPALDDVNDKADRAVLAACISTGASANIKNSACYLPMMQDEQLTDMFCEYASEYIPEERIYKGRDMFGSSDVGDVCHILPTIQPTIGGTVGSAHCDDFMLNDLEASLLIPVKIISKMCVELLLDSGKKAKQIKEEFVPVFTKEEYIKFMDELLNEKSYGK